MARYPKAIWIPTPNFGYPTGTHGQVKPIAKVYHIMGGSLVATDNWFQNPTSKASAQFGIGKNCEVHQYADTLDACWHAGILNQPDTSIPLIKYWNDNNINPNRYTIGIEHEGQPEDIPTQAQLQASIDLSAWLDEQHPTLGETINEHLRHSQIDTINRAHDPGPNWDIQHIVDEHHMALTEDQKRDIVISSLSRTFTDIEAVLSRMGLRVIAGETLVQKYKTDGAGALTTLKSQLEYMKSQADYIVFVNKISDLQNQLTYLGV